LSNSEKSSATSLCVWLDVKDFSLVPRIEMTTEEQL